MKRLHELGTRLLGPGDLPSLLDAVLDSLMALLRADIGSIQTHDPQRQRLDLAAWRHLAPEAAARFKVVTGADTPCGLVMQSGRRVVSEDLLRDPVFAPHGKAFAAAGSRALVATPMFSRSGVLLGVITVHFHVPHRASAYELRLADACAQQAAHAIERERAREALLRSEECLASGERLNGAGSWVWTPGSPERYCSRGCLAVLGLDGAPRLALDDFFARVHEDDRARVRQVLQQVVQEGRPGDLHYRVVLDDRSVRQVHERCHAVAGAAGGRVEVVGSVVDITARLRAEDSLRHLQDALAHLNRQLMLGEMTSWIAHEINQPLAAMVTDAQAGLRWLSREQPDLPAARAAVERIAREGLRAGEVVGRIRSLARNAGPRLMPLHLPDLVHEVLGLAGDTLLKHRVALRLELDPALPALHGDRVQIQQVLMNLLMNGIEALHGIDHRAREVCISVRRRTEAEVVAAVTDNGTGIAPCCAERLCEAFFSTKRSMGLGLAISRRIVESHGGRLWLQPQEPWGTMAAFSLPCGEGAAS
jgi:signal transduction histidine kinase